MADERIAATPGATGDRMREGHDVDLDFRLMDPAVVAGHLDAAGMELTARIDRAPIPDAETATERSYLLARVPPA